MSNAIGIDLFSVKIEQGMGLSPRLIAESASDSAPMYSLLATTGGGLEALLALILQGLGVFDSFESDPSDRDAEGSEYQVTQFCVHVRLDSLAGGWRG